MTIRGMLALSFGSSTGPDERRRLVRVGSRALETVTGTAARPLEGETSDASAVVVLAGPAPHDRSMVPLVAGQTSLDGATVAVSDVARSVCGGDLTVLSRFLPPFAACFPVSADEVVVATDAQALRHVYVSSGPGWAAASTSSLALAAIGGRGLDVDAIGHYSLVGAYDSTQTPYVGVTRLGAGYAARLSKGTTTSVRYDSRVPTDSCPSDIPGCVAAGAAAVQAGVAAALASYPDASLELSGGLDSRMVLAGMPRRARTDRKAVTLGIPGSDDWVIAAEIARSQGLDHRTVDISDLPRLEPKDALELAGAASLRRDYSGNALAFAALDWVEERIGSAPRLSGQNGELARGFYYAGQRDWRSSGDRLVSALARWRILTNDPVDASVFAGGVAEEQRALVVARLQRTFTPYVGGWLRATDEFYLRERMASWLGAEWSASCLDRTILAPFFHPDYVDWARSCDPLYKRGSRVFSAVMQRLDPELAALRSTAGMSPADQVHIDIRARLRRAARTGDKVASKVRQRVRHEGKPPTGAAALVANVQEAWAADPAGLESVAALSFLDRRVVEAIGSGRRTTNSATIALLIDLAGMLEVLG